MRMFRKIIKKLLAIVECSRGAVGWCIALINRREVYAKVKGSIPSESILAIGSKFKIRILIYFNSYRKHLRFKQKIKIFHM